MSRISITVEGGLLAADLVERIGLGDAGVPGQQAKDFSIDAGHLSAEIQSAFSAARVYWDGFKLRREASSTSPVTVTREAWVYPLFERLGYTLTFQRAATQIGGQSYAISHRIGTAETATPVHIVAFNQKLDERGEAKRSPHALVQEYLNRGDALWGIVTNGRELRLLRNSARSSRPSYVAIDLETILDGNLYSEFALAFRLLHRSRLPTDGGDPHDCLLETWYQRGIEEGGRVRERLRVGVKAALEILGSGFLGHPANNALRARLDNGDLTEMQLYRELLSLIYRLLFLMVAEERRLLFVPAAGTATRYEVYLRWYGIGRLRDRAERRTGDNSYGDLWEGLKATFRLFRDGAAAKLALSALNGELFGPNACPDLEDRDTALRNDALLDAIHRLSTFQEQSGRKNTGHIRRVNYAGLDVEELGSIYESLLDYRPQVSCDPWSFALAAGSERKATGSYYTPPELVHELIDSALIPVMQDRLASAPTKEAKEKALLSLTICDPAAGSGHFLLAAARRVGRELAMIRSGEAEPAPDTYRAALRDVIRRCLYAVDKNPLAVDLCKVALWIEGHRPGLPLSFLDHRIRCGDSLVGVFDLDVLKAGVPDDAFKALTGDDRAVCSELRKRNQRERAMPLAAFSAETALADLAREFIALADMPDDRPGDVHSKERLYRELLEGEQAARLRRACDAWTAAFFAPRSKGRERTAPTTADVWNALAGRENPYRAAVIDELSARFRFFHWRLEFPEVFDRSGFDVMLGNPPWETMSPDAKEFFAIYDREVRFLAPEDQKRKIEKLKSDPAVASRWNQYCRDLYTQVEFYKESGRYVLFASGNLGKGDLNVYRMFVETALDGTAPGGTTAQFVPENFYNGANASAIRAALFDRLGLTRLLGFENTGRVWFPRVDTRMKFCLYVSQHSGRTDDFQAAFRLGSHKRLAEATSAAQLVIPVSLVREFSPDALAIMEFAAQAEIDICRKMYERYPKFGEHIEGLPNRIYMAEVHMGNDRSLFTDNAEGLPVFEGRMIDLYDYRTKGYRSGRGRAAHWDELPFGNADKRIQPQWRIPRHRIPTKLRDRIKRYRIGFCDVGSPTNERSLVAALIPPDTVCGDKVPTILFDQGDVEDLLLWLGVANSLTMDFIVRKKVALKLSYTLVDTLPFPRDRVTTPAAQAIISHAYSLATVGPEMEAFRVDASKKADFLSSIKLAEDPVERARLMAEIEALVAGEVYGLSRDELRYILDPKEVMGADYPNETFRVLKESEIKAYGEYRTRRLVLEAWDRFAENGTFDPARLRDPRHFGTVQKALAATRGRVESLERELQELLARSDTTSLPTLFVEGDSDVAILTAAWRAFRPTEPLPVTILAAGGTRQMESLAGRGAALRQLLGDRLIFALAGNDREGRALVEDGRIRKGGLWRQQSNGIHWCLLAPTAEFEQAMKRFGIPESFWPFTIENAFPAALRRQAIAKGVYAIEEATVQAAFLEDPATAKKALAAAHQLDQAGDDAALYFRPPAPETKLAFAHWITAQKRRDRAIFAAFGSILEGLAHTLEDHTGHSGNASNVRSTA